MSDEPQSRQAWVDALGALDADRDARVPCPTCGDGFLGARWIPSGQPGRGEVVLSCERCGSSNAALYPDGPPASWPDSDPDRIRTHPLELEPAVRQRTSIETPADAARAAALA